VPEALLERRVHQERQLRLDRARIEMEKAEEDLRAFEASSKADLETRRIAVEKARREIETTEAAIGALVLRAPRSGLLVVAQHPWEERKLQVGDTVYVGWSVMSIPDLSAMRVVASLSDVDDGKIAAGMPAKCTLDAYPGETFNGVVRELTPIAQEPMRESLRRAFRVIVELTRTDAEKMRPGMSVKVEVETARQSGALLAPRAALDMSADRPRAALAKGGDAEVRLGPCNASECVVESGLEEGTRLRTVR
jgi:multidrug efflux pump subunit AcrA (membrane-fusion protein)